MNKALVLIFAAVLTGCAGIRASQSDVVSQSPQAWDIQYSPGMPIHPAATNAGIWRFPFPVDPGSVNYVTVPYRVSQQHNTLSMTARIDVTPGTSWAIGDTECPTPANVRLFFQRRGDDLKGDDQYYRWWSHYSNIVLQQGQFTTTVDLDPAKWSSVLGMMGTANRESLDGFHKAWQDVARVGMTFGGGCFYGHGVGIINGTAHFTLISYSVQ